MQVLITTEPLGDFESGDIIAVAADSHVWGRAETMQEWVAAGRLEADFPTPGFSVLRLVDEPPDLNLVEPWLEVDPNAPPDEPESTITVRSRLWCVSLSGLPGNVRNQLQTPGADVTTARNRRSAIIRKDTNVSLPDTPSNDGETKVRGVATGNAL